MPLQQSLSLEHGPPVEVQQTPLMQVSEKHCVPVVHVLPVATPLQKPPPLQLPLQHWEPDVHAVVIPPQVLDWQVLLMQPWLESQQVLPAAHPAPAPMQGAALPAKALVSTLITIGAVQTMAAPAPIFFSALRLEIPASDM